MSLITNIIIRKIDNTQLHDRSLSCHGTGTSIKCSSVNQFYGPFDLILMLNATFSNISAISWRPVLVVEEAGVSGENHRPWASNW
jgi:hypothetical protein